MILCEPRRSVTELEVDVLAADILNRHELSLGMCAPAVAVLCVGVSFHCCPVFFLVSDGYPGLAAIWEEERQRRQALKIEEPLSPPPSPGMGQTQEQLQGCVGSSFF